MKVKIIKATHSSFWYSKHIGEVFEVEPYGIKGLEYVVLPRQPDGDFYIDVVDCEVV